MPHASAGRNHAVSAATLAAATLVAQQVAGKATRDTLFLSSFPVDALPMAMIAAAATSVAAVALFSSALTRRTPARVVPLAVGLGTVLLLVEWGLSLAWPAAAAVALYLHMAVFGSTVVSGFWSLVNERFDPYAARRAMARMGFGASLGGVAGGLLAWGASSVLPVTTMLAVMAALNVASLLAMTRLGTPEGGRAGGARDERAGPLAGLRITRAEPYLRNLAAFVALGALTETLLDFVLSVHATQAFAGGPELMSFFALFHTGVGLLALLLQVTLAGPSLRALGLAGTVAVRPLVVAAGALAGLSDLRLLTSVLARGGYGAVHNSLFRSGYELLFTPLPERHKRPAKAIVDVGFDKVGALAGGLVILAAVALRGAGAPFALLVLAGIASLAGLAVSRRLHRGYVSALEESLRSGALRLDLADVRDGTTMLTLARTGILGDRETLLREVAALRAGGDDAVAGDPVVQVVADLRSGQAETIRRGLRRAEAGDPAVVGSLIPLLLRNDVFLDVLRVLRRAAPRVTGQLLDALLDPQQDPVVRQRIARVLRGCATPRAVEGLVRALDDPHFAVRRQSATTLLRLVERDASLEVPREAAFGAAVRELADASSWTLAEEDGGGDEGTPGAAVRTPAERALAHVFALLSLALPREPLQIAHQALAGDDAGLRGTALEYLANVLPDDVRRALWARLRPQSTGPGRRSREQAKEELLRAGIARGDTARRGPR